jgi:hypothetical protein
MPEEAPERREEPIFVEPRWPIAIVVGGYLALAIALRIALPDRPTLGPSWLVPGIEGALLIALLLADPEHIEGRAGWLRKVGNVLILALTAVTLVATSVLIADLVRGAEVTEKATTLLASGALIWVGNVMVFSLLYWQFDGGGPLARFRGDHPYPDFAFTQHMSPEFAPPGWRPLYVDYLILGLTTSTAFSPTDVMPLSVWAKLTMALQSIISLMVVGLVIARAVNVFS